MAKKTKNTQQAKAPAVETPKPEPKERYTRMQAVAEAMRELGTDLDKEKLAERANALYVEHGGADNLRESRWATKYAAQFVTAAKSIGLAI